MRGRAPDSVRALHNITREGFTNRLTDCADLKDTKFGTKPLFEASYDPHQRHSQA